jgi:hypothetical protein
VLPPEKVEQDDRERRYIFSPGLLVVAVILSGAWWLTRAEAKWPMNSHDPPSHLIGDLSIKSPGATRSETIRKLRMDSGGSTAVHPSVVVRQEQCEVHQRLRNQSRAHLTSVPLQVTFMDAEGEPNGSELITAVPTNLAAGGEEEVVVRGPCSRTTVGAVVQVRSRAAASETGHIVLPDEFSESQSEMTYEAARIVVELSDRSICSLPSSCELQVSLQGGGQGGFEFQRLPNSPHILASDNSLLIAHLRSGLTATILIEGSATGSSVTLTDMNVHEAPETWLARLQRRIAWQW